MLIMVVATVVAPIVVPCGMDVSIFTPAASGLERRGDGEDQDCGKGSLLHPHNVSTSYSGRLPHAGGTFLAMGRLVPGCVRASISPFQELLIYSSLDSSPYSLRSTARRIRDGELRSLDPLADALLRGAEKLAGIPKGEPDLLCQGASYFDVQRAQLGLGGLLLRAC
jgi:hypothetical protein